MYQFSALFCTDVNVAAIVCRSLVSRCFFHVLEINVICEGEKGWGGKKKTINLCDDSQTCVKASAGHGGSKGANLKAVIFKQMKFFMGCVDILTKLTSFV